MSFYYCRFDENCQDISCKCHLEYYQRAFNRVNHNNLTTEKLFKQPNPNYFFKMKLLGKLYKKCIQILRELDNFIPTYTEIYETSPHKFLTLFSDILTTDFSISRVSGVTQFTVCDDCDRFQSSFLSTCYVDIELQ